MNIEKDWPTLVEAKHVKSVKKKYNIKKKSNWIKINAGVNFNKTEINSDTSKNFESSNEAVKQTNGCNNIVKGIKHLHINKSHLIRHFDNSDELYNYREDSNINSPRQRTICKLVPVKQNMVSVLTDVRVNYDYINDFLSYGYNDQGDIPYQVITDDYNSKIESNSSKSNLVDEKIVAHQTYENEIMYVRSNVLSYYFSEMNLYNDKYLVSIMDENGWVCLDALLKFPRLLKTQTSLEDIPNIAKNIKYPEYDSESKKSSSEAFLEFKQDNVWKIRRSDMTNFKINLVAFSNTNDYNPRQHELPFPKYTYDYFFNKLDDIYINLSKDGKSEDSSKNYDWKEVKPRVRRSRKSESCLNENQNSLNVDKQDNLDFEFSSEPNPLQSRNNPNLRRKQASKKSTERSRSRTISGGSEDELDESNIYILSMRPKVTYAKILDWADISDSDDDEYSEIQIPCVQLKPSAISQRLLAKHPSGDRHPNPDYQTRSKIQEQLREIISDGLRDWKNNNEIIRRNRHDSSSSTSSDIKVQICHDEKAFKLMQKSLQNHDNMDYVGPRLPTSMIPIEQKVEVMKQKPVNVMHFKPLPEDTDMINYEFLSESSTSSLLNPVHYDSWTPSFTISPSINQLLDKLLENVQYQYLNIENPVKFTKKTPTITNKTIPINPPNETKPKETDQSSSILINDIRKEITKIKRSCKVGFYPVTKVGPAKDKHKDKTRASTQPIVEYDVGYAYSGKQSRRQRTISGSTYSQYNDAGYAVAHGIPIPFNDHPSQLLLQENGFEIKFYHVFRKESLADREKRGIGRSQEMNTLFRFWSFFLRENKNKIMYEEFQKYAWEDALKGYRYGVECLFRMYTYKLEQRRHFNELQYQDFQKNVLKDLENNHLYGLEKFWAFLKYSGRKLDIHPRIKKLLEKYKTLDDFRINFIPPQGFHSYKIEHPDQAAVESGIESE